MHWREYRPVRYAALANPAEYFEVLGEEAQAEIWVLARALAGRDRPGEGYLDKVGRLNMARMRAEEQILRALILVEPKAADEEKRFGAPPSVERIG